MGEIDAEQEVAKHPAKFSDPILTGIRNYLDIINFEGIILDPFAGVGRMHELATDTRFTVGVEIEAEWAEQHPSTITGDSRFLEKLGFQAGEVQGIVTSPTYGNRMADAHVVGPDDKSTRHTYTHTLGRQLTDGNTGKMQWGGVNSQYRIVHRQIWKDCVWVLGDGGLFVLNISDHYRKNKRQFVTAWHMATLTGMGIEWGPEVRIETRRQKHGANGSLRMPYESVLIGVKSQAKFDEWMVADAGATLAQGRREVEVHGAGT